ncbi:MAG: dephospho-CoA kinase [Actinomycetia bacterium]|nr:dephospho-CoA kinase [Actinomycetes bacterium]
MAEHAESKNLTPAFGQASVADTATSLVPQMTLFISGSFGAGKSTVTRFITDELAGRGHEVCTILLDEIGHELLVCDDKLLEILVESFGDEILSPDGQIDRSALAAAGFADEASHTALNAIMHPPILARAVARLAAHATADFCVVETPLPFSILESTPGHGSEYLRKARENGCVVLVTAPLELRLQRVIDKGFTVDDACARMAVQPDEAAYRLGADLHLENDGDLDMLHYLVSVLAEGLCR